MIILNHCHYDIMKHIIPKLLKIFFTAIKMRRKTERSKFHLTSASESLSFWSFSLTLASKTCSISASIFFIFKTCSRFSSSICVIGFLLTETIFTSQQLPNILNNSPEQFLHSKWQSYGADSKVCDPLTYMSWASKANWHSLSFSELNWFRYFLQLPSFNLFIIKSSSYLSFTFIFHLHFPKKWLIALNCLLLNSSDKKQTTRQTTIKASTYLSFIQFKQITGAAPMQKPNANAEFHKRTTYLFELGLFLLPSFVTEAKWLYRKFS